LRLHWLSQIPCDICQFVWIIEHFEEMPRWILFWNVHLPDMTKEKFHFLGIMAIGDKIFQWNYQKYYSLKKFDQCTNCTEWDSSLNNKSIVLTNAENIPQRMIKSMFSRDWCFEHVPIINNRNYYDEWRMIIKKSSMLLQYKLKNDRSSDFRVLILSYCTCEAILFKLLRDSVRSLVENVPAHPRPVRWTLERGLDHSPGQ